MYRLLWLFDVICHPLSTLKTKVSSYLKMSEDKMWVTIKWFLRRRVFSTSCNTILIFVATICGHVEVSWAACKIWKSPLGSSRFGIYFTFKYLGIPRESLGIPRESLGIPRESLGIPKESLQNIPFWESLGIPRLPYCFLLGTLQNVTLLECLGIPRLAYCFFVIPRDPTKYSPLGIPRHS